MSAFEARAARKPNIDWSRVRIVVWVCQAAVSTGDGLSFDGTEDSAFHGYTHCRLALRSLRCIAATAVAIGGIDGVIGRRSCG
jgi:hypothetical protein